VTHPNALDFKKRGSFELESPQRIIFGEGAATDLGALLLKLGLRKPLVVTGKGGAER